MDLNNKFLDEEGPASCKKSRWGYVVGSLPLIALLFVVVGHGGFNNSEQTSLNAVGFATTNRVNSLTQSPFRQSRGMQNIVSHLESMPMARLAINALDAANSGRDVVVRATKEEKEAMKAIKKETAEMAKQMAGVTAPMGFFDPVGFSADCDMGRLLFYREVELKHGRIGMLASLGILVGENYHPLFGGNIDVPAIYAFQQTPLQTFWVAVVSALAICEGPSVQTFDDSGKGDWTWKVKGDRIPGDFGYDPLGLKPKDTNSQEFLDLQNKELNNGRLAMLAAAGMLAQELVTGQKILG